MERGNKMHYYDIQTSETEELWNRWVGIEKYNRNFSLLIRSIIQNSGRLPEKYLNQWTSETKSHFSRLKVELSQKVIDEIKELIKETYQYILSKRVELEEEAVEQQEKSLKDYFKQIDIYLSELGQSDSTIEYAPHARNPFEKLVVSLNELKLHLGEEVKIIDSYFREED